MAGTARNAGSLYGALEALSSGAGVPPALAFNLSSLTGGNQAQVADAIVDALCPVDGAQDTDAARDAMSRAFSDLLDQNPAVDLSALTPPLIEQVVESYIAHDLSHRIELDVGKAVLDKAPTAAEGVVRLDEMKAYVRQEVAARFRARAGTGQPMTRQTAAALSSAVLRDTFDIFESYL
jgi:hypothetical protein